MVKLVWPDGRTDEIEHAFVEPAIGVIEVKCGYAEGERAAGASMHQFRRIQVGNVDTGDVRTLWVHLDTDVHVVKRVVDAVAGHNKGTSA